MTLPVKLTRAAVALALFAAGSVAQAQRDPAARLVKQIAIGDESVPGGLTRVGNVLVGPGGRVYVEQPQDNVIRMFDSTGTYVKNIGGKGQGPGETGFLFGIGFVGDTLWSLDLLARRFAFFSADGAYQSTLSPPPIIDVAVTGHGVTITATTPLAGGSLLFAGYSYGGRIETNLMPPVARVVGTREGRVLDTIALTDSLGRGSFGFASGTRQSFTADPAFAPLVDRSDLIAVEGRGLWFAVARRSDCGSQARYVVARISLQRDTLWRTTVECPRVSVPRNFVDSVVAANKERVVRTMSVAPGYAEAQIRPKIGNVSSFTPLRALHVGNDGSIWLRPFVAPGDSIEVWVRADAPAGAPQQFTLPPRAQLKVVIDASRIWVLEHDADDLPTLVRYRVMR